LTKVFLMNKILFTLLSAGVTFYGIQEASAGKSYIENDSPYRSPLTEKSRIQKPLEKRVTRSAAAKDVNQAPSSTETRKTTTWRLTDTSWQKSTPNLKVFPFKKPSSPRKIYIKNHIICTDSFDNKLVPFHGNGPLHKLSILAIENPVVYANPVITAKQVFCRTKSRKIIRRK